MGPGPNIQPGVEALAAAQRYFEPQLNAMGLSEKQILERDTEDLEICLQKVDAAAAHPESFGTIRLRYSAEGRPLVVDSDATAHTQVGILPLLLERKVLILDRLRALRVNMKYPC